MVDRAVDTLHWLEEVAFELYAAANTSEKLGERIKRFINVVSQRLDSRYDSARLSILFSRNMDAHYNVMMF